MANTVAREEYVSNYIYKKSYDIRRFQFVPKDITVTTVWNLANVKTTSSCAIRPMAASAGMDIQVYIKCT